MPLYKIPQLSKKLFNVKSILYIIIIIYILIYITIGLFAQPTTDDFYYVNKTIKSGFYEAQKQWYLGWTGRYSATAILSLFSYFDFISYYWLVPFFFLVLTLISYILLVGAIGTLLTKSQVLFFGSILLLIFYTYQEIVAQTFYWLTGCVTYQLGNILYLILITKLIYQFKKCCFSLNDVFQVTILCFIIIGLNETIMVLVNLTIISCLIIAAKIKRHFASKFMLIALISVVLSIISIAAPGNTLRALEEYPNSHFVATSILNSMIYGVKYIIDRTNNLALLGVTILALPTTLHALNDIKLKLNNRKYDRILEIFPLFVMATIIALNFPSFFATGSPPIARTKSVIDTFFLISWFPTITIIVDKFIGNNSSSSKIYISQAALLFIIIGLLGSHNNQLALYNINGSLQYYKEMQLRYDMINKALSNNILDLDVPSLTKQPSPPFACDIASDTEHWINKGYAEYFRLKTIRVVEH
jgi:hypothetical protein